MTYLAPRHAIKAVASECEIRGGEYVAYDRANFTTSLQVWKPQAEQGDAQAQVYVGEIYEKGLGTSPDLAQAAYWYQKAADQGLARGLSDLAYLYEQGRGVPQDSVKALNLYRKSAGIGTDELTFASEVTAAKREASAQIEGLTLELSESNAQIEELRRVVDAAQAEQREQAKQLLAARRAADALRAQVTTLRNAAGPGAEERKAEIKRLESQLAASEATIARQQLDAQAAEAASAAKTAELTQRLQGAAAKDKELRAQLGGNAIDAQQAHADLAAARARMDAMTGQIAQLQEQLKSEQAQLAEARATIAARSAAHGTGIEAELARLRAALAEREARLAQQQSLLALVQSQREAAEQEVNRLKTQQTAADQQQQQQRLDGDALRAQLVSIQQRLMQSQQKLTEANAAVADQQSQVEVLRAQLARRRETASADQDKIRALSAELASREAKLIEQQTRIAALQAEGRSYQEEIARLKIQQSQAVVLRSPDSAAAPAATATAPDSTARHMSARDLNLGSYFGLIIGNDKYENMPELKSAVKDASAVEAVLRDRYGFKTRLLTNATRTDILLALNEYAKSLGSRDSLLIYYAGHGELNERNMVGYWLPVNARRDDTTEWISDRMITDQLSVMAARHILVIADSCYSGAMTRSSGMRLIAQRGNVDEPKRLLKLASLPSRTVLTSGGVEPVLDGGAGTNSIFARSLIEVLTNNHGIIDGTELYDQVFDPVHEAAGRFRVNQSPRYSELADAGHLNGEFLLIPVS